MDKSVQSAYEFYRSGNLERAENICKGALETRPDDSELLHLLGLIYYRSGNHDLALRHIRKAIKFDPQNADAYYDLGNLLLEKGQLTKALTNYRKAVKLDPEYAEAYNNMGIAYHDNLQLDKAIKSYGEAIRSDPSYAEAHNNLGVAFQEKKELDEAITHFQKALLLDPEYSNAYHNLVEAIQGKGYEDKGKPGKSKIYAIYRCMYGEDFLPESIRSIRSYADRVFVFWDEGPWGGATECVYKGEVVKFPGKIDGVVEKVRGLNDPRIELIHDHRDTNDNQLTHFVNDIILPKYEKPSMILFLEVDHVFRDDQIRKAVDEFIQTDYVFATTDQVEIWKGLRHRLRERPNKVGAIFCNMRKLDKMPETLRHGGTLVMPKLSAFVHNFGFAVSEKTMYWKHLLSIAVPQKFGEAVPAENWYEEKWLRWDYGTNNENLGISEQDRDLKAVPYDVDELPELIKQKYSVKT